MQTVKPAAPSSAVPMLDVTRENSRLATELDAAIAEVSRSGAFVHGPACQKFEAEMARYCSAEHAIGCASGSDALLLSLLALGVGPGDEVIVPSFTFFATASAVWRLGRSEEHTSELQSLRHLVCRLLLEKKKEQKSELQQ